MLLDLLFPKQCLSCATFGAYICPQCINKITRHNQTCIVCGHISKLGKTHKECQKHTPLSGCIMATEYKDLTRLALHKIKYQMQYHILAELLEKTLVSEKIKRCLEEEKIEYCTEIPMHQFKLNQRGFNQATLIAKWIEKTYHIPYKPLLEKTKITTAQMKLKREERIFNVKDSFKWKNDSIPPHSNILLIDDVTTTASTLEECATILKNNGVLEVWGLVIASKR